MEHTILILILPFLSFLILGLAGMRMKNGLAGTIGTASLAGVALLSYLTAFNYFTGGRTAEGIYPTLMPYNFEWLPFTTNLHIDMGIMLDPISVMMLVVISTVSLMVHIYSFGYMKGEKGFQRYYAFLSLFTMSMLGLVVATNIFQMYVFWELVGVSSYLLIGFYYTKKEAIAASKKAFIVTRFADLGFLIGILIYGYYAGTFSFTPVAGVLVAAGAMIPLALGLMFIGGAAELLNHLCQVVLGTPVIGERSVAEGQNGDAVFIVGIYNLALAVSQGDNHIKDIAVFPRAVLEYFVQIHFYAPVQELVYNAPDKEQKYCQENNMHIDAGKDPSGSFFSGRLGGIRSFRGLQGPVSFQVYDIQFRYGGSRVLGQAVIGMSGIFHKISISSFFMKSIVLLCFRKIHIISLA